MLGVNHVTAAHLVKVYNPKPLRIIDENSIGILPGMVTRPLLPTFPTPPMYLMMLIRPRMKTGRIIRLPERRPPASGNCHPFKVQSNHVYP